MLIIPSQPPMGWNSWDVYLGCPDHDTLIKTADYMAENLLPSGYQYFVIDALWYENQDTGEWSYDSYGRLQPDQVKFPFGIRYFSDYLHSKGLKFGLHMMRGMNRSALNHGYKIFGTDVLVDELYDFSSPCKWSDSWAGIKTNHPFAARWYDSIVLLFAEWGVDFIKYDDLIDPDYYDEIVLIHNAIEKCGRDIVLSLSPGNKCDPKDAEFYSAHSSMWRISGDYWDNWDPQTKRSFRLLAIWNPYINFPGWPDADMLPLGRICEVASVHGAVPRNCKWNSIR